MIDCLHHGQFVQIRVENRGDDRVFHEIEHINPLPLNIDLELVVKELFILKANAMFTNILNIWPIVPKKYSKSIL